MIELYKHNLEAYLKVKEMFQEERKACIIHATGTGKSFVALKLIEDRILENPDSKIVYFTPSNGIASQVEEHLVSMGLEDKYLKNIEFIYYQTANNKLKDDSINDVEADLFITDEFHHIGAPEWTRALETIFSNNMDAKIFGMTATAVRRMGTNDEENVAETFFEGNVASEFDLADAIAQGVLPEPEYHTAPIYLLEEAKELEEFINSNELDDADASKYIEVLQDIKKQISKMETETDIFKNNIDVSGKYIYFCPKGSDIKELQEAFMEKLSVEQRNNVEFYQVHSATYNSKINENVAYNFYHNKASDNSMQDVSNKLRVMFAIDMYNEGIHVPDINGIIMGRETRSDILYYQQLGRSLAVKKKSDNERENNNIKPPVVIDLMGNINNMYTLSQKVVEKRKEKLGNFKDEKGISSKGNFTLSDEENCNQNNGIKFGLSDEIIDILDAINEIKSYRANIDSFDLRLKKVINEFRETGTIKSQIKIKGIKKDNPTYNFLKKNRVRILKIAENGNEDAIELVTKLDYFKNEEEKFQDKIKEVLGELLETGKIIRSVKINGRLKTTESYSFMVGNKKKILKAAENGNKEAMMLVSKEEFFKSKDDKFQNKIKLALDELRETGKINFVIMEDGKRKQTPSYFFFIDHKKEILKAAEEGNEEAMELVSKEKYFNRKRRDEKIQDKIKIALDELRETGTIIKMTKTNGKSKQTPSYKFFIKHRKEILSAAEEGNEEAIELVTKDDYFKSEDEKIQDKIKTALKELRETGVINPYIEIDGTKKSNPSYTFIRKAKKKIIDTVFCAADKNFEEMSETEKLSVKLVSQSELMQKHLALEIAKEEHNASCDLTKLAEMISNKKKGNGNQLKL